MTTNNFYIQSSQTAAFSGYSIIMTAHLSIFMNPYLHLKESVFNENDVT